MYRVKLFILVLGSLAHLTISAENADLKFSKPRNPTNEMSIVIFGKPLSEVEDSIKRFVLSLTKPKSKGLTHTLEKTSLKGENVKDLITISTKLVVENLRSCCKNIGILRNESSEIIAPDKNETLISTLIHNGLILVCEIVDFLLTGSDLGFQFLGNQLGNQTSELKFTESNWKKPKYMDFIIFSDELIIYIDCMTQDFLIGDFKKAINYGSTHSANEVIHYLKKNIKKPRASRNSNFSQSICSAIENIKPGGYEKCISDWDKIQSCFVSRTRSSSKTRVFLKFMKELFPRKWVNSLVDLNRNCKLKKDQDFECKIRRRPIGTRRQMEYIVKTFTGKSITKTSPLSRVIRQFSRIISKSPMARSIVQDCTDYIVIYHQGEKRKNDLKKKSETDSRVLKRYQKISKALDDYKQGITEDLLNAIVESNQIPIYVEKSLRKVTPKFLDWPIFASALMCLALWINSIYEVQTVSSGGKFKAEYQPFHRNTQGLIEIHEEFPDLKRLISKEQALDNLLRTLNQVSSENRALTKNSAFTSGFNNILLVLMFLETLSAVTILMQTNIELQFSNGGGNGQSGQNGQIGQSGQPTTSGPIGVNADSSQEMSEEDLRRKKRSFDLDSNTTFVSDLPDVGILPLNSSTNFFNITNNENKINDTENSFYEITERIVYTNISIYRTKNLKFDNSESFEDDYSYSWEFNETILRDG